MTADDAPSLTLSQSAPPPHRGAPGVGGLSLPEYAGVRAGLAAGAPLEVVLDCEGVAPERWERASEAWDCWLAEHVADDPWLLEELERYRTAATARYAAPLAPFDSDADAWSALLRALQAHADPGGVLAAVGLRPAELARLHRAWAPRVARDLALAARLLDPTAKAPTVAELPRLERAPARGKPPTAGERPTAIGAAPAVAPSGRGGGPAEARSAAVADVAPPLFVPLPQPRPKPAPPPIEAPSWGRKPTPEIARTGDLDLAAILAAIKEQQLPFVEQSEHPESPPSVAPTPFDLPAAGAGATSELSPEFIAAVARRCATPYESPKPTAQPPSHPVAAAALPPAAPVAPAAPAPPRLASSLGATGELTLETLQAALSKAPVPFARRAEPRGRDPLTETAEVALSQLLARPPKSAMPFAGSAEAPPVTPIGSRPASSMGETHEFSAADLAAIAGRVAERAVPFGGEAAGRARPANAKGSASVRDMAETREVSPEAIRTAAQALPFPTSARPTEQLPELTLEQYASFCAEVAVSPHELKQALARYGLAKAVDRATLSMLWESRFAADPALRARFDELEQAAVFRLRK